MASYIFYLAVNIFYIYINLLWFMKLQEENPFPASSSYIPSFRKSNSLYLKWLENQYHTSFLRIVFW